MNGIVLRKRIEKLQQRLNELYLEKGSFIDPSVIIVSQEIDALVLQVQRKKKEASRSQYMIMEM